MRGTLESHARLFQNLAWYVIRFLDHDAASVDHFEVPVIVGCRSVDAIARDPGLVAYDGATLTGDAIEESRFSYVGQATTNP